MCRRLVRDTLGISALEGKESGLGRRGSWAAVQSKGSLRWSCKMFWSWDEPSELLQVRVRIPGFYIPTVRLWILATLGSGYGHEWDTFLQPRQSCKGWGGIWAAHPNIHHSPPLCCLNPLPGIRAENSSSRITRASFQKIEISGINYSCY